MQKGHLEAVESVEAVGKNVNIALDLEWRVELAKAAQEEDLKHTQLARRVLVRYLRECRARRLSQQPVLEG